MPTLLSALIPLVVGSPVLLRETEKDPATASILRRSIAAQDPQLAACCEPLSFPHDDTAAYEVLLAAPCVVATGSDETLAAISARLAPTTRFVGYGHRFSIAICGPHLAEGDLLNRAAEGIARDVIMAGYGHPIGLHLLVRNQSGETLFQPPNAGQF